MSVFSWDKDYQARAQHLADQGLYSPHDEHDACGVGMVAAIDGEPRRSIIEAGIEGLQSIYHRGAVDADGKTGDGAGILIQIPLEFFKDHIARIGLKFRGEHMAVGMMFLPKKNFSAQETCRAIVESEVLRMGYAIYGWRQVPVRSDVIGDIANESRPEIEQILIAQKDAVSKEQFELDLYFIRARIEKAVREKAITDFYICSLSSETVVYKGLFKAEQVGAFYPDLMDARFVSAFALFHQRFSTNTAPAWHLAQPFRMIAHNGEINTVKGNTNFMRSHVATAQCENYKGHEEDFIPLIPEHISDTGALDRVVEYLTRAGRPLPLTKLILIPSAWSRTQDMPQAHKDMFSSLNSISEQWDGPAALVATDGNWVIAGMDRNGLRPLRYTITKDGMLIASSESGMIHIPDTNIARRGRLGPGDIMGIDLAHGQMYFDDELKDMLAAQTPYHEWVKHIVPLSSLVPDISPDHAPLPLERLQQIQAANALTLEDTEAILHPMAAEGKEAIGSMGDDTPMAILSDTQRGFHHFFRQNFSQVTNPPIDSLRERGVMSLYTRFGNDGNFLAFDKSHSEILLVETPILLSYELSAIKEHFAARVTEIDTLFDVDAAPHPLRKGLDALLARAEAAVRAGQSYLVLTDERMDAEHAPIPMILAVSAVQAHLVKHKLRKRTSILVRTSECIDVHAAAVLIGVGATVVNPYMAEETLIQRHAKGLLKPKTLHESLQSFQKAMSDGLLKIMAKMGISVISAYRGGMNYEALGLSRSLVAEFFPGMPSRISGIGIDGIESRVMARHSRAFSGENITALPVGGFYRYRARSERHAWEAEQIHLLQSAVGTGSYILYRKYAKLLRAMPPLHLRDLLDFKRDREAISVDGVESITDIRKRFVAPAMSLGALSPEAHETLAIAMNRIGATSNSGEGGEGPERYTPLENGDNANSTIKQIASGRFGVTAQYLNSASEIQIKVAQGAKPGEGGQLPGFKVTTEIARLRHATPGVMLISPPPHHDIYSIEDLAQLIYDLKQINKDAIVSVKLVAQSGIGTIASGVAKAMADKIVIAGHNGGTGASAWSSVKHAGIPWEMGLSEVNQTLTLNRLRHRVKLQTDGGLKTGRDIVIAAMLGAEEFALGTASLVAMGCLMVRQCHSNTCPVGLTTQDAALREKFEGTVDKVINLFSFIAEDVREILASLGYHTLEEVIGRTDLLTQMNRGSEDLVDLDLNALLAQADPGDKPRCFSLEGRNEVPDTLDAQMLEDARDALKHGEKIQLAYTVSNTMRAIGTRISSMMVRRFANETLQDDHIILRLRGSAGQSLGAFAVKGLRIELYGDANDYVGKGLSGGTIILRPRPSSSLVAHENVIIGNTVLYGATSGTLYASGQAGERFAVRNSGATAVAEGCGSNGCEYMTGGTVAMLGDVGHNFAAGMTGGMAFVYDANDTFMPRVNPETVSVQRIASQHWENVLRNLLSDYIAATSSPKATAILQSWEWKCEKFWQICPNEMISKLTHPLTDDAKHTKKLA